MCGLVGVAGDLHHKDTDIFKELLFSSQVRGADATGIAAYAARSGETAILKKAVESATFLNLRQADSIISSRFDVLMGHTRKSTYDWQSKYSDADAHPFRYGRIIGCHNGSVQKPALEKLPKQIKGAIDSEQIIANISEEGIDKVLPNIWGAWALSLLDTENKVLGFVRNKERPLAFAFSKDKRRLYWASEGPMLEWVLWRNGVELTEDGIIYLKQDELVEFDLSGKQIAESFTISQLVGGKEPEKKYTPPTTSGHFPRGTTGTTASKTPAQLLLQNAEQLELQLIGFDYSNQHKWSKKTEQHHAGIIRALTRMYSETWAHDEAIIEGSVEPSEPDVLPDQSLKDRFVTHGCAFCMEQHVEDNDLTLCGVGKNGELLCPTCMKDDMLRQIAGINKPACTTTEC